MLRSLLLTHVVPCAFALVVSACNDPPAVAEGASAGAPGAPAPVPAAPAAAAPATPAVAAPPAASATAAPAAPLAASDGAPAAEQTSPAHEAAKLKDPFGKALPPAPKAISGDSVRDVQVLGSVPKAEIVDVIRKHGAHVTNCVSASSGAPAKGLVVVKLVIGGDGRVTLAHAVESSIGRADVEECIVGAAKTWAFPQPKGGGIVIVTYPFRLE
jgi:hypothetical protein